MKLLLRSILCVLAVGVFLAAVSSEAGQNKDKDKGKDKDKKRTTVNGVVLKVSGDRLTINVAEKKKKDDDAPPVKEASFKLDDDTKVVKAPREKGDDPTPAKVSDLKAGQHVAVTADDEHVAVRVVIQAEKKKND
jgi:hypothetical protein